MAKKTVTKKKVTKKVTKKVAKKPSTKVTKKVAQKTIAPEPIVFDPRKCIRVTGAREHNLKEINVSIPRDQLVGSTFTISNVGSHAGRFATPVINYPEVAILAVGRAREGMVTKDGWFRVGKVLPLSLACDHRVVDGAMAALCLAEIIKMLENPEQLLTPARA